MRPADFITSFALFTALTAAWPQGWDPLGTKGAARIRARQDNSNNNGNGNGGDQSSFDLSISTKQGDTATTKQTSKQSDGSSASSSNSGDSSSTDGNKSDNKDSTTTTGRSGKNDKTTEDNKSTKTFDARLPAGGVSMVTPDVMEGAKYYKIKDYVTFGFNFTSLSVYPSAIDILASCSTNSATYTIAQNHSVTQGSDAIQAVTWDTGGYQATASVPLLLGTYTLMIHDAAKDIDATPSAGYLGTWEQFTFGMYIPQPYTPLADYVCATCSGAMGTAEKQAMGFLIGMGLLTVASFTWFAGVAGLW